MQKQSRPIRILYMYYLFSNGEGVFPNQIKQEFIVSDRTFQRDIDILKSFVSKVTLKSQSEKRIRYDRCKKGYFLDKYAH